MEVTRVGSTSNVEEVANTQEKKRCCSTRRSRDRELC